MRHSLFAFAIAIILSGCAVEFDSKQTTMSEDDAMDILKTVPVEQGVRSIHGKTASVSAVELEELLYDMIESGEIDAGSNVRGAIDLGGVDLSMLTQIFGLLQGGQANNVFSLTQGLLDMTGDAGGTSSTLDDILGILQLALPIISMFAPQFAPIIQAVITIAPVIVRLIGGLFGRRSAELKLKIAGPEFAKLHWFPVRVVPLRA